MMLSSASPVSVDDNQLLRNGDDAGVKQAKFHLKQINELDNMQALLLHFQRYRSQLDTINLVTILSRLARIYSNIHTGEQRAAWSARLKEQAAFVMLLDLINSHLVQAHALLKTQQQVPGLNARCLNNLLWSVVKLQLVSDEVDVPCRKSSDASELVLQLVDTASTVVMQYLSDFTGQGLGNLLWSYARLPSSSPELITSLIQRMVDILQDTALRGAVDAQALASSLWAATHVRSANHAANQIPGFQTALTTLLVLAATRCADILSSRPTKSSVPQNESDVPAPTPHDGQFSYQSMVSIVWSYSALLGSACASQEPIRTLFLLMRQRMLNRLHTILSSNLLSRQPMRPMAANMNEQVLCQLIEAYDKAGLMTHHLLQAVLDVAAMRINRPILGTATPVAFKPEELFVLLRACRAESVSPRLFLTALNRALTLHPTATAGWSLADNLKLQSEMQQPHVLRHIATLPPPLSTPHPHPHPHALVVETPNFLCSRHQLIAAHDQVGSSDPTWLNHHVDQRLDVNSAAVAGPQAQARRNSLLSSHQTWLCDTGNSGGTLLSTSSALMSTSSATSLSTCAADPRFSSEIPSNIYYAHTAIPAAAASSGRSDGEEVHLQQMWIQDDSGKLQPVLVWARLPTTLAAGTNGELETLTTHSTPFWPRNYSQH